MIIAFIDFSCMMQIFLNLVNEATEFSCLQLLNCKCCELINVFLAIVLHTRNSLALWQRIVVALSIDLCSSVAHFDFVQGCYKTAFAQGRKPLQKGHFDTTLIQDAN